MVGNDRTLSPKNLALLRQFLATVSAAWTCVSHGLLTGYTAQAIPSLMSEDSDIEMTEAHKSWISSIVPLVAVGFAPISSPLCTLLGRRQTMMIACIPMCVGWFIITYASNANMILVGRAMCGAVSAISIPATYSYVAEIASSRTRGFLGSLLSVGWCFGLVISYSLGSTLAWNWLALVSSVVPMIQFLVLSVANSSPRWLVSRGRFCEARRALAFFRGGWNKHVECELKDCMHQLKIAGQGDFFTRIKMLVTPGVRKAVAICLGIFFFAMMTGFTIVNYHAKALLVDAKVTDAMDPNLGIIIIGMCQMFGNIVSALIIDKCGRKSLLYISSAMLCLSQSLLGSYFYYQDDPALEPYRWLPVIFLIMFVLFLPIGWGSVTYILVSELVPTSIRTETAILCNSWEQLLQFAVLRLHSFVCFGYGPQYLHWAFAVTAAVGGVFVFWCVPETSGKTLEEIEIFFTHLRREAMDMIGDEAMCRELRKKKISMYQLPMTSIKEVERRESESKLKLEKEAKAKEAGEQIETVAEVEEDTKKKKGGFRVHFEIDEPNKRSSDKHSCR